MRLVIKDSVLYDEDKAKEYLEEWLKTCPIEVSLETEDRISKDMLHVIISVLEKQESEYKFASDMQQSQCPSYMRVLLRGAITKFKEDKEPL